MNKASRNGNMPSARLQTVDLARGLALVAMAVYHFTWDLEFFGYIEKGTANAGAWKWFARGIASSFLFLVGFSLVLATREGLRPRSYFVRMAKIIGAAALVTLATYFATPDSFVFFGILHHIAVASVLGLLFVKAPLVLVLGVAALFFCLPVFVQSAVFDSPWLAWAGLSARVWISNDYVPLFPWFGMALLGIAAAQRFADVLPATALNVPGGRYLTAAGRHSLAVYLLHQPLLIGLIYLVSFAVPPANPLVRDCNSGCLVYRNETFCQSYCSCVANAVDVNNITKFNRDDQQVDSLIRQCIVRAEETGG